MDYEMPCAPGYYCMIGGAPSVFSRSACLLLRQHLMFFFSPLQCSPPEPGRLSPVQFITRQLHCGQLVKGQGDERPLEERKDERVEKGQRTKQQEGAERQPEESLEPRESQQQTLADFLDDGDNLLWPRVRGELFRGDTSVAKRPPANASAD